MAQLINGVVVDDAQDAQTNVQPEVQEDNRSFLDKVVDTGKEYIKQADSFVDNVVDTFKTLPNNNAYTLDSNDQYSQEIKKEADETVFDRVSDSIGDGFNTLINLPKTLNESEDSFLRKFTGTDYFRNQQSADTANELVKNFYARDDVMNQTDPNKVKQLQDELYSKIRPLLKPEKQSEQEIQKSLDNLSLFKQVDRQQKENESDKLNHIIEEEISQVVNKRYTGGTAIYNQTLIEQLKKGASEELNEVYQQKKDLQISALELGIDKEETQKRIDNLDKIIETKKKQIDKALQTAYLDQTAFEQDATGRLKIYNKSLEGLSNDEINLLVDYERNTVKDINTLLNVNRLNQLKKGNVLDRVTGGLQGIQGAASLTFDTLDTLFNVKTVSGGIAGRNYSVEDRESMINALASDENYLSLANKTGAGYLLSSTLKNFDDIGQVILGGGLLNKVTGINKVTRFLDNVDGKMASTLATGAKGVIEGYAYNNQLSMTTGELNTDDYQVMNTIFDAFGENVINFGSYAIFNKVQNFGINYTSLNEAKAFRDFMIKNDPTNTSWKNADILEVQDMLKSTKTLIRTNIDKTRNAEILKNNESLREWSLKAVQELKDTGGYTYKGDGLIITNFNDSMKKITSPTYILSNIETLVTKRDNNKYLYNLLESFVDNPTNLLKGISKEDQGLIKTNLNNIKANLNLINSGNLSDEVMKDTIRKLKVDSTKIVDNIKGFDSYNIGMINAFDLNTGKEFSGEYDPTNPNYFKINRTEGTNSFMFAKSRYTENNYLQLKQLLDGKYTLLGGNYNDASIKTTIAEILNVRPELIDNETGLIRYNKTGNELRIEGAKFGDIEIQADKLKLVQAGMTEGDIIGLLMSKEDFQDKLKNINTFDDLLTKMLPLLKDTVFDNPVQMRNFRDAFRLFASSDMSLGIMDQISEKGELLHLKDSKPAIMQQMIIDASIKFRENDVLVGQIMSLGDNSLGNITKAELISSIFTGVINKNILVSDDALKIKTVLGKDLSQLVGFKNKFYNKKIKKVMDRISSIDSGSGASFKKQFYILNDIIQNVIMKETLSSDVAKRLNQNGKEIPKLYFQKQAMFKNYIQDVKDKFGITTGTRNLNGLLTALKKERKTLKEGTDRYKELSTMITKIESSGLNLSYRQSIEDVINELSYLNVSSSNKNANRDMMLSKAKIYNILEGISGDDAIYMGDENILSLLKKFQTVYLNKKIELEGGSKEQVSMKYVNEVYELLEGMYGTTSEYVGFIKEDGSIGNYGDEPHIKSIIGIFDFNIEQQRRSYNNHTRSVEEELLNKYKVDIKQIRQNSLTQSDYQINLLRTDAGRKMGMIGGIIDNVDLKPISIASLNESLNKPGLSLLDKYEIANGHILNMYKFFISRGMYLNEDGSINKKLEDSLKAIQDVYTYKATKSFINTVRDSYSNVDDFIEKGRVVVDKFISVRKNEQLSLMTELIFSTAKNIQTTKGDKTKGDKTKWIEAIDEAVNTEIFGAINYQDAQKYLNQFLLDGTIFGEMLKSKGITEYDKMFDFFLDTIKKAIPIEKSKEIIEGGIKKITFEDGDLGDLAKEITEKIGLDKIISYIKDKNILPENLGEGIGVITKTLEDRIKTELNDYILDRISNKLPHLLTNKIGFNNDFINNIPLDLVFPYMVFLSKFNVNVGGALKLQLDETIINKYSLNVIDGKVDPKSLEDFYKKNKEEIKKYNDEKTKVLKDNKISEEELNNKIKELDSKIKEYDDRLSEFYDDTIDFKNIKSFLSKLGKTEYEIKDSVKKEIKEGKEIVNSLFNSIKIDDDIKVGDTTLKDILDKENVSIREKLLNGIRERNSYVYKDTTVLDGYTQSRGSGVVENSDGLNKILSLKYLLNTDIKTFDLNNLFKYNKVEPIEYTQSFFRQFKGDDAIENSEIQKIYVIVNNLQYIYRNLQSSKELKYNKDLFDSFGIGGTLSENVFDRIIKSKNIGDNYIAIPTYGEEASKGIFINPNLNIIKGPTKNKVRFINKTLIVDSQADMVEIYKTIDNGIFADVRNVLGVNEEDPTKFAKRFKQLLSGGNGLLDENEKVYSFMITDNLLWSFYNLSDNFKGFKYREGIKEEDYKKEDKQIKDLLSGDERLNSNQIEYVKNNLSEDDVEYLLGTQSKPTIKTLNDLKKDEIDNIKKEFFEFIDKDFKTNKYYNDIKGNLINGFNDIEKNLSKEFNNDTKGLIISELNKAIEELNGIKVSIALGGLEKNIINKLENIIDVINKYDINDFIEKPKEGINNVTDKLQSLDKKQSRDLFLYSIGKNNKKIETLIRNGLSNKNVDFNLRDLFVGNNGLDVFSVVGGYLNKESFDGMGYMSKGLAIKYFESRTGLKYNPDEHKEYLKDLKAHILGDGVLEKTRQEYLSDEMQEIFDNEIKKILKSQGLEYNENYIISYNSGVKTGKDKFTELKDSKVLNQGVETNIVGFRELNSNDIKIAASNAINDKEEQVVSMQMLAGEDNVLFRAIQNLNLSNTINKVNKNKNRMDTGRSLSGNKGYHNLETLDELAKELESSLFNTLKGLTTEGSALKLSGGEKYKAAIKDKKGEIVGYEWKYLEENTAYISEDKYIELRTKGELISIGKDKEGNDIFGTLAFRNPVPSPYNISMLRIEIDYSAHGKNLKISPTDTFLKKEGDFDADTVNLLVPTDDNYIYQALYLSSLKQTSVDFKHDISILESEGDISALKQKINSEYVRAIKEVSEQMKNGTFQNYYIPTKQVGEGGGLKKGDFETQSLQGSLIESSVAKEKIGTVSVSQEWLYYIRASLEEYDKTGNESVGNELVGYMTISDMHDKMDLSDKSFFAEFASILQMTLDYAKSVDKFPPNWLDQEITPMLKNKELDINSDGTQELRLTTQGEKDLGEIKKNLEVFAKNIKQFKSMTPKEFMEWDILSANLPPVLRDKYLRTQKGLKDLQSFKIQPGELDQSYRQIYIDKIPDGKNKIPKITMIDKFFNSGRNLNKEDKDKVVESFGDKTINTIYKNFDRDNLNPEGKNGEIIKYFEKGSDEYNALSSLLFNIKKQEDKGGYAFKVENEGKLVYSIFESKSAGRIEFKFDGANFSNYDLLNKYGDTLAYGTVKDQVNNAFALQVLGYRQFSHLLDELRRTEEVLSITRMIKGMDLKTRKEYFSKFGEGIEDKFMDKIQKRFDEGDSDYQFIRDITGVNSFKELSDKYKLELQDIKGEYELSILEKGIDNETIDSIIKEVEVRNNVNRGLLEIYNNIDSYIGSYTPVTSIHIDSLGRVTNGKKQSIPDGKVQSNLTNVMDSLMHNSDYRNQIMNMVYDINPNNVMGVMKDMEELSTVLSDRFSLAILDKLNRYAPDIAKRFYQRDLIRGNELKTMLDNYLTLRNKFTNLPEEYRSRIDNHFFKQNKTGSDVADIIFIPSNKDIDNKNIETLFNQYKDGLRDVLGSSLNKMLNITKYDMSKINLSDNKKSFLFDFLEMQNGQISWVLNEKGIMGPVEFQNYINGLDINIGRNLNTSEIKNLSNEVFNQANNNKFFKFIRAVKTNMYGLAFAPIIVPAALSVTLLQMLPDFFINLSKKSKSFNNQRVDNLLREHKILESEVINYVNNIHETMETNLVGKPARWLGNFLRVFSDNPKWKSTISTIELMMTNGFAINDVLLGPLRRKVAGTRAFDTYADAVGGVDAFFNKFGGDPEAMRKVMDLIRVQAHSEFNSLSGGSSTSRLGQTTALSSGYHNLWNFMQTWSTVMVNQHIKASSNLYSAVKNVIKGDRKVAQQHWKEFSEYLGGQLRMNMATAYMLAKYQMVYDQEGGEDGDYDLFTYVKTLNNTIAGLESFSPVGAVRGFVEGYDTNEGGLYNMALLSKEITGRFGREFNLPKNIVAYVFDATGAGVQPEKILDGVYDILSDRTNGFIRYNKFEIQDGYFEDGYTTNLFGIATGVGDLNTYQEFKENMRKYGSQRAFQELDDFGLLSAMFGSSNYWKTIKAISGRDSSFKLYEQMVEEIFDIRENDKILTQLISSGMNQEILNTIMIKGDKIDKNKVEELFKKLTSYSPKGLGDFVESDSGLTAFQYDKTGKISLIDNLVVSELNDKYGKEIIDAITQNDFGTISKYVKEKVGPEMMSMLANTGNKDFDETATRKMLLIAAEKSELTIPTLVSTLIYDKSYEYQKNNGLDETTAKYLAIQNYGHLANGNLGMVNDVANIYTIDKYGDRLKPLFHNRFKEQFSKSLENKLLIDMAVGRAFFEEGDIESAELRGDMTTIFNSTYNNMKEKNNGVLSKEDSLKLMADYEYINTELMKLNGKVDPLRLFHYREGVMLSMLQKTDLLAEMESTNDFDNTWGDVKDNLVRRFLKFAGEKKAYDLEGFEELVKDKYNKTIGRSSGSYGSSGFNPFRSSSKPQTARGNNGFNNGNGTPLLNRALDRGLSPSQFIPQLLQNNPYGGGTGPRFYNEGIKQQLNQLYKKYYEQYSKDLVKRNPEYINRGFYNKKARAEMIGMKSNLNRTDFRQIPRLGYSKLSKGLIPGWSYNKE